MNIKQYVGIAAIVVGICSIAYGVYSMQQISNAKKEIHKMAESQNPVVQHVGKKMEDMIGGHRNPINWFVVVGGALVVLGAASAIVFRKR